MKFETEKDMNSFVKAINDLRVTLNHHEKIETWQIQNLKWIWRNAHSNKEAKECMRIELGW